MMQLNFVGQDQRSTTTLSTTFPTKAATQFSDPDGMEGLVIHMRQGIEPGQRVQEARVL